MANAIESPLDLNPTMNLHFPQLTSFNTSLKSVIFAMGWKGQMRADLEQAKTHKHQHQINTNLKNTNHTFYSVRGRLLGYAQNRSRRDFKSKVCNHLIELQ